MSTSSCECWLVIESTTSGFNRIRVDRMAVKKPSVGPKQIAVKVELVLPNGLFVEPTLTARIRVADDAAPEAITAETLVGVEHALQGAGFTVRVVRDEQS